MCGIFGIISDESIKSQELMAQARHAERRGKDSSGLIFFKDQNYLAFKADYETTKLVKEVLIPDISIVFGHSRLITNGMNDNQPVIRDGVVVLHNGIIFNDDEVWNAISLRRALDIDTEAIAGVVLDELSKKTPIEKIPDAILGLCKGTISCAILIPKIGKLILLSNNGSLYFAKKNNSFYFASEKYSLAQQKCINIEQLIGKKILDIPASTNEILIHNKSKNRLNLIPSFLMNKEHEKLLQYKRYSGQRCVKCVLTSTMPFITFDSAGVCNYCNNYKPSNEPKPIKLLEELVSKYKGRNDDGDCIVPFSGGRDSTYALHLIVKELKLRPITFTYDWGMVTDLARRNISRMCSGLGVENIIVADDIKQKREYIKMNLNAWLKKPNLGMLNILMAGDKHFFRYLEHIKKETGIELNIWGMCPLETTHFKAGFLGIPPYFEETKVYTSGITKQFRYQALRLVEMSKNLDYFNSSIWDTLSGEYHRSIKRKSAYYHLFDYHQWKEDEVNLVLDFYGWERAPDTDSTWRIGDGTAAFYNYVYRTVAGFSEHDTFRSNQIREGDISREHALELVESENLPRYQNIKWYLDTLGMDFKYAIGIINSIPKLY
jgi:hypothetical protein